VLYADGGAGPVHAARYAAELGIKEIVIAATSAVQGGMGLVSSDVVYEYGKTDHFEYPGDVTRANRNFEELVSRAYADLRAAGFPPESVLIERSVDMRYRLQTHELNVPLEPGALELTPERWVGVDGLFDELYERTYGQGSGYREAGKDVITFRVRAVGKLERPKLLAQPSGPASPDAARKRDRAVFFQEHGDFVPTRIYQFDRMQPGMQIQGPAVIESPITTIVVNPANHAAMDEFRNIRLTVG
jgi:N-methylhydantoinase A